MHLLYSPVLEFAQSMTLSPSRSPPLSLPPQRLNQLLTTTTTQQLLHIMSEEQPSKVSSLCTLSSASIELTLPRQINAAWNSTVGSIKETYGAAVGASGLEAAGRDQAAQGEVESNAAQAKAYGEATADRLGGKVSLPSLHVEQSLLCAGAAVE